MQECRKLLTENNIERISKEVAAACESDYDSSAVKRIKAAVQETNEAIENLWKALEHGQSVEMITERNEKRKKEKEDLQAQLSIEMSKQIIFTAPQIRSFLYSLKKGNINDDNNRRGLVNIFLRAIYLKDDQLTLILNGGNKPTVIDDILLDEIEAALEENMGCSSLVADAPPDLFLKTMTCVMSQVIVFINPVAEAQSMFPVGWQRRNLKLPLLFLYLYYVAQTTIMVLVSWRKGGFSMEYISAIEASEKWGVSLRQVQRLLADNRIPRARKYGRSWMIPSDVEKPVDPRKEKKPPAESLSSELARVIEATSAPMPTNNPDAILKMVKDERSGLQYESELAYLRGDFQRTMRCYNKTEGDEAARLRASLIGVAAAISLGDYPAYQKIEAYLKSRADAGRGSYSSAIAELALASVAVSVSAPNMVPKWLSEGDFSALTSQTKPPYMLYLRAKYFMCIGKYEIALAVAQTALTFSAPERGIAFPEIYLRVVCALACNCLGHENETKRRLLEVMRIALPHGFVTPFAEHISDFGGLMEQCLEEAFPGCSHTVIGQWERTVKNWITFHNHFAKDNITKILSLRENHLAQLVARHVPYAKIAKQFNISVGRLKNIMLEIYEKLYISSRDELAQYVLASHKGAGS